MSFHGKYENDVDGVLFWLVDRFTFFDLSNYYYPGGKIKFTTCIYK